MQKTATLAILLALAGVLAAPAAEADATISDLRHLDANGAPTDAPAATYVAFDLRCDDVVAVFVPALEFQTTSSSRDLCTVTAGCTTAFVGNEAAATSWYVNYVWTTPPSPANVASGALTYTFWTAGNVLVYVVCIL